MSKKGSPMSPKAAARVQAATAKQNAGKTPKSSFAVRAQRAAAKNNGGRKV